MSDRVYILTHTTDLQRGDRVLTDQGAARFTQPAGYEEVSVVRTVQQIKPHEYGAGNLVVTFTDGISTVIGGTGKWYRLPSLERGLADSADGRVR